MTFAVTGARLSGPASVFAADVRAAPVHRYSGHVVAHLLEQVKLNAPNLNCLGYGVSVYEVGDDVVPVDVTWRGHASAGDALYAGLLGLDPKVRGYPWPVPSYDVLPPSVGAFRGVPLPDGARAAAGTDGALTVHRPSSGQTWELWQPRQDGPVNPATGARGWSAAWGGYVSDLATCDGRYPGTLGVCASGLMAASGAVRIAEARTGVIDHAVAIAVPHVIGGRWSYPASRCDALPATSTAPFALHEGQRFRLPASVDVTALRTTSDWAGRTWPVHPACAAIARAAQVRGLVVTDQTGSAVVVAAEEGRATMHAAALAGALEVNPWTSLLAGRGTWQVLDGFPWPLLEALPHDWGKP